MKALESNVFQNVLLVESDEKVLYSIKEVLKSIGFGQVTVAYEIQGAMEMISNGLNPDWVITCMDAEEKHNGFHLLSQILEDPKFKKTRVSLILTEEEKKFIPLAFELGALSWHSKPFTRNSLEGEVNKIMEEVNSEPKRLGVVAARYLREYLEEKEDFPNLTHLGKSLITAYPKDPDLFVKLAESYYMSEEFDQARKTLLQAKYLGNDIEFAANQLLELMNEAGSGTDLSGASFAEVFGVANCMIIDSDENICEQIKGTMENLGVENIHIFHDGNLAIEWIEKEGPPSVILQEWKIPGLSGPGLVQRIRQMGHHSVPIIVVSSLVQEDDKVLLMEMGVSSFVGKPVIMENLNTILMSTISQENYPSETKALEQKFRAALADSNVDEAKNFQQTLMSTQDYPAGKVALLKAELCYHERNLGEAKTHAIEAFRHDSDSIFILDILGRILLELGDNENAIKAFEKANELSPKNLERLCQLAETNAVCADGQNAEEYLEKAKGIDGDNDRVATAGASVALISGDSGKAKNIMGDLGSLNKVISVVNNRAVSLVRQGDLEDAMKLYDDSVDSVPEDNIYFKSVIRYNMALTCVRQNKLENAKDHLTIISKDASDQLAIKVGSLMKRVDRAIKSGSEVVLNTVSAAKVLQESEDIFQMPIALHLKPGELCLHLIYRVQGDKSELLPLLESRATEGVA